MFSLEDKVQDMFILQHQNLTKFHFYFLFHCQDLQCKNKDRKKKFTIMFALESSWPSFIHCSASWMEFFISVATKSEEFSPLCLRILSIFRESVASTVNFRFFEKGFSYLWHYVEDFVWTIEIYNSISPFSIVWLQLTLSVGNYLMSSLSIVSSKKMFWLSGTRVFFGNLKQRSKKRNIVTQHVCLR